MSKHYGWPQYWMAEAAAVGGFMPPMPPREALDESALSDPHLRSTREVIGYGIQAADGEIGNVYDFIADDEGWVIRYMAVATGQWLPGRKVILSPQWIESVSWPLREVMVALPRQAIEKSPEYDPTAAVNREQETRLYDYYGIPTSIGSSTLCCCTSCALFCPMSESE